MSSYLKTLKEIKCKQNMDENLKQYIEILLDDYKKMSTIRLTMNYYTFYESVNEYSYMDISYVDVLLKELSALIDKFVLSNNVEFSEDDEQALTDIRLNLTERVNELADLSKAFGIAEYAINRVEHRFDGKIAKIDDNIILQSMLQYIFADKENVVISDKIKLINSQLPVRMAKSKLYNMISNTLTLYKGSDISSIEAFEDAIKNSAMLNIDKQKYFKEYSNNLNKLINIDYQNITREEFDEASEILKTSVNFINNASDCYTAIMEIINDLYEIAMINNKANDFDEKNNCINIISKVNKYIMDNSFDGNFDDIMDDFSKLEGVQEELMLELPKIEGNLYDITGEYQEKINLLNLTNAYETASKCNLLNSTSIFVNINDANVLALEEEKVDDDLINKIQNELIEGLSGKLDNYKGLIKRGIIASVLSELPVRFRTSNELSDYISSSLAACKDEAEKTAFVEIIDQMMN